LFYPCNWYIDVRIPNPFLFRFFAFFFKNPQRIFFQIVFGYWK
jgi:hypothetical protein